MSKFFLTVVHIVIHNGDNNGEIHRTQNIALKTSKPL